MNLTALPDGRAARDLQTVAYADRRNGQLGNTQRAPRVPNGSSASRGSVTQLRPAGQSADPDHLQADYFLRLLVPSCRQLDCQIDQHQKAIAIAETRGNTDDAHRIRQLLRIDEQERQTLKALIDRLQRRFPVPPGS